MCRLYLPASACLSQTRQACGDFEPCSASRVNSWKALRRVASLLSQKSAPGRQRALKAFAAGKLKPVLRNPARNFPFS